MIKKVVISLFRILGLIVLLAAGYVAMVSIIRQINNQPLYGQLEVRENLKSFRHFSDNFIFEWNNEERQLRIANQASPEKNEWASVPGESFLHAALGSEDFTESRGSYFIRNKIRKRFNIQRIDEIKRTSTGLSVMGKLTGDRIKNVIDFELEFKEINEKEVSFKAATSSGVYCNRLYLTYATDAGEQFFGFGTQYSHFNLKGKRVPILVSEQGIGRGQQPLTFLVDLVARSGGKWYTSYAPVPYYITSDMRSLFLSTYEYAVFDLRKKNKVQVSILANELEGIILSGDEPAKILERYTAHTGRMKPLPEWINRGAIVGMQGGTDKVYEVWNMLNEHSVPVAGFWLQDWVGQRTTTFGKQLWWNWTLDQHHYHSWDSLVSTLSSDSVKVMGYINPYLADVSEKENVGRNLLAEALEKDLLVKDAEGQVVMVRITSFSAAIVDLSKREAREWIINIIREEMMGTGFSGWMADFGESLPMDAVLENIDAKSYHNKFPEVWAEVNAEAISTDSIGDIVYFNRSGYTKSPGVNRLFWLGDQMTSWDRHDGIKTAVTGLLSSGISGYSLNHSDIGGYTAITDKPLHIIREKELLMRWIELNAFTAVFRTHEGNRPDENIQIYSDAEILRHFSKFATIYRNLAPYRRHLMKEAQATGMPVVRHPFLHYPNDKNFYNMSYQQFMLGEDVMVCPVLDNGRTSVEVYLPNGSWRRAFSDDTFESAGARIKVEAPIGSPAVFYRDGSEAGQYLQ